MLRAGCANSSARYTTRDALFGAAAMVLGTLVVLTVGAALQRSGYEEAGEILKGMAFPAAMTLSMPFTFFRGQPWRAQAAFVGAMIAILAGISFLATFI
jgi:hypothetical protein